MRVHPSDSLSLQPGKSPLHRSSPAGSSRVGPLLQVPSRDIRTPGHASRRVHKTTFPQPTAAALGILIVTVIITSSARPRPAPAAVAELGR